MALNLRERQLTALGNILSLSGSGTFLSHCTISSLPLLDVGEASNEDITDQWKVLIYDHSCRDIISPLMNVGALRNKGVTLHLLVSRFFFFLSPSPTSCTQTESQFRMRLWFIL
jgi:hypothetical protein